MRRRMDIMKKIVLMLIAALLLLSACEISKPHLPSWDVDLTVPLINEHYFVSDLADSINLFVGEDNVLTLIGTGEAESQEFGDVSFNPAAFIDPIPLVSGIEVNVTLPFRDPTDTVELIYGFVDYGTLSSYYDLDDPANTQVSLSLPDIHTPSGNPLTISGSPYPGWQDIDLAGYSIGIEQSGQVLNSLTVLITIESNQPDGTPVGTAGLGIDQPLSFSAFEGYIHNYRLDMEAGSMDIQIDYPLGIDEAIQLQEANLLLAMNNEFGFGVQFYGDLYGINHRTGIERTIPILDDNGLPFYIAPANQSGPVITEIQFSNTISELLQIMPDEVELRNAYLLIQGGSNSTPGFVQSTNKLLCTYQIDAPFTFTLTDHPITMEEPSKVEMPEDIRDQIGDTITYAALKMIVINKLPIGATATIYVGTDNNIDPSASQSYSFTKEFAILSSEYEGPEVNSEGEQLIDLTLNQDELRVFQNPEVYLLPSFSFEATSGPVTIYASPADYIHMKGMLTARVHIEEE